MSNIGQAVQESKATYHIRPARLERFVIYKVMKKVIAIILLSIIFAPCLLIVNESEHVWPNIVGCIYMLLLVLFARTRNGSRIMRAITKTLL